MSIHFLIPGSKDPAHPANSNNIVVVELQDDSSEALPKAPHTIQISQESLALFSRKVEEKIEESIVSQAGSGEGIEAIAFDQAAFASLVEMVESKEPENVAFGEQVTLGDPDYFMGTIKDSEGKFQQAYECFLRSANRGNMDAKYSIAFYHYSGRLGFVDHVKCYHILKDFVDSKNAGALYLLSQFYYSGLGGCLEDHERAFAFAERSAQFGSQDGKLMLASCYQQGVGIKMNTEIAFGLFNELYESNYKSGIMFFYLGMFYLGTYGVEKRDAPKAFELFKKAVDLDCFQAYFPLGMMYFEGVDVGQDYNQAFTLFQQAIQDNQPEPNMYLAHCYYFGLGTSVDKARARAIMNRYPAANFADSFYHLGCFAAAEGEHLVAFVHFQNALKASDTRAYGPLGICYFEGRGTEVNYKKAFDYLRKVIFFTPESFSYLARCYDEGKGTPVKVDAAIKALERSVSMWPKSETHYELAQLYLKIAAYGVNGEVSKKVIDHFSRFLELNQNKEDTRIPMIYYLMASYTQIQYRFYDHSIDVLNRAVQFARQSIDGDFQNPAYLKMINQHLGQYLKRAIAHSIEDREKDFNDLSLQDFVQVMRYDLYMQKSYLDYYLAHPEDEADKQRYKHLSQIHAFLYEDLDREWSLLRKDQLRRLMKLNIKLVQFLVVQTSKYFHVADLGSLNTSEPATAEEVADSFMPIMPKKKPKVAAKPKGAQKKNAPKQVPAAQQKKAPVKGLTQPANQNRPPVVNPEVKPVVPSKAPVVKAKETSPVRPSVEAKRIQKILSIAQSFNAAQEAVVAYYSKDVSSGLRKSIEAVFDKKSISQDKVIALMEHLAKREYGSCVKNANGGARLIVGELSVGCHAFHGPGDKNHLGFIAELRKLMVALYQGKQ